MGQPYREIAEMWATLYLHGASRCPIRYRSPAVPIVETCDDAVAQLLAYGATRRLERIQ